jgi:hypothetical protein
MDWNRVRACLEHDEICGCSRDHPGAEGVRRPASIERCISLTLLFDDYSDYRSNYQHGYCEDYPR